MKVFTNYKNLLVSYFNFSGSSSAVKLSLHYVKDLLVAKMYSFWRIFMYYNRIMKMIIGSNKQPTQKTMTY